MSESASILCVGNELTEGRTLDRHGRYLSRTLGELGISVRKIALIPDERALFLSEVKVLMQQSRLVIVTGGLGPTSDDLTRDVVAAAVGVELEYREELWQELQARFGWRQIAEANRRQAFIPAGSVVLKNIVGTAPGFMADWSEGCVVALPGPPRELSAMVDQSLLPLLRQRLGIRVEAVTRATAFLIPESELEEALAAAAFDQAVWGTRVEEYRITFALRGGSEQDRLGMLARVEQFFDGFRIRSGEVDPVALVSDRLRNFGRMLVTAESCTGGLVAKLITDLPGSSEVLWGAVVSYCDTAKSGILRVPPATLGEHGAVSRQTVEAMARGALAVSEGQAGVAVAITGIAGPGGGTVEKPVGTVWIAVCAETRAAVTRAMHFYGSRDQVRRRSAVAALLLIEDYLT